eukprot:1040513-Prorocentrum_minimum.AAC.1
MGIYTTAYTNLRAVSTTIDSLSPCVIGARYGGWRSPTAAGKITSLTFDTHHYSYNKVGRNLRLMHLPFTAVAHPRPRQGRVQVFACGARDVCSELSACATARKQYTLLAHFCPVLC